MNQTNSDVRQRLACLELSLLEGGRPGKAVQLLNLYGSSVFLLENVGRLSDKLKLSSTKDRSLERLLQLGDDWKAGKERPSDRAAQVIASCKENDISWVTWEEAQYPDKLRLISDPPAVLYYRGRYEALQAPCISIVGSRRATAYGQKAAYETAWESASAGFTVVSGLAKGIDASAHKGALDAQGMTIAVMAGGLDQCYPKSHLWLYRRICDAGLAVSEYPPDRPPEKWHFIYRNRLISGLSLATVVAQAGPKSGSIRTAQLAAEQGRDVFGVPGDLFNPEYLGVHNLIQDGVNILTSPKGLVKLYGDRVTAVQAKKTNHAAEFRSRVESARLSETSERAAQLIRQDRINRKKAGALLWLYDQIDDFGCTPEQLCERTGRDIAAVRQGITILELEGIVQQENGQKITRT